MFKTAHHTQAESTLDGYSSEMVEFYNKSELCQPAVERATKATLIQ